MWSGINFRLLQNTHLLLCHVWLKINAININSITNIPSFLYYFSHSADTVAHTFFTVGQSRQVKSQTEQEDQRWADGLPH
jgi:hypothetical protein